MRAAISVFVIAITCGSAPKSAGQDHTLRVPVGFHVSVFAQNLEGVRYLVVGPGNAIYASQPGKGVIVKLPDANHDGVADTAIVVARDLRDPFGIAFRGDTMYVGAEDAVERFDPGGAAPVTLVRLTTGGDRHSTIQVRPRGKPHLSGGPSCHPSLASGAA